MGGVEGEDGLEKRLGLFGFAVGAGELRPAVDRVGFPEVGALADIGPEVGQRLRAQRREAEVKRWAEVVKTSGAKLD